MYCKTLGFALSLPVSRSKEVLSLVHERNKCTRLLL